jgi:hypothetical protein
MSFVTIFSTPKPFTDPFIATIQRNAIRSWVELGPEVEVVLIGDEPGIQDAAEELGIVHVPEVERNQWGTPLVRSLLEHARAASESPIMAIVNADILLMPDYLDAVKMVHARAEKYLIVGRRWGLDIEDEMAFQAGWQAALRAEVEKRGDLHPMFSIDYFVFPRDQYREIPDFVIGRPQWDNWMIYHARQQGWPVVDATASVTVVHQNHDYRHLPGNKPPHGLEEGKKNRELAGGERAKYMIIDANRRLVDGKIIGHTLTLERIIRKLELWLMRQRFRGLEWQLIRVLRNLRMKVGEPIPADWIPGGLRKES